MMNAAKMIAPPAKLDAEHGGNATPLRDSRGL